MKVFFLLSVLGLISCITYLPKVVDIWYNYEYPLSLDYSHEYNDYSFRLPVTPGDKMEVEIKVSKGDRSNFNLHFKGFPNKPSNQEVFSYAGETIADYGGIRYDQGDYTICPDYFKIPPGCNYLVIHAIYPLYMRHSYLTFKVNAAKYGYSIVHDLSSTKSLTVDTSIFKDHLIPVDYKIFIKSSVNP